MKKNCIVVDFVPDSKWVFGENFIQMVSDEINGKWIIDGYDACGKQQTIFDQIKRYFNYFWVGFKYFRIRNEVNVILSYQQFYGIIMAYFCALFHVKKSFKLVVMTFIYNPKSGFVGKIYDKFVRMAVESNYIDRIICFSKAECEEYKMYFNNAEDKFTSTLLGKGSHGLKKTVVSDYIVSAGRSNRDYEFLINVLKDTDYQVKIICDCISDTIRNNLPSNIQILNNTFGNEYLDILVNAKCVVIPLFNENISSGQLVLIQAMEAGVPVIVLGTKALDEYIADGKNGFLLKKDKRQLLDTIEGLYSDEERYDEVSANAMKYYYENHTVEAMARSIAGIVNNIFYSGKML